MLSNYRPTFDQDQISYRREERDGYLSVLFDETPELNTQLLNPTMKLIIEQCDGTHSIPDIQRHLRTLFPDVNRELIENDVMKALVLMDRYALLSWDPESPFVPECKRVTTTFPDGFTVVRAMEDDLKKVIALIQDCKLVEVTLDQEKKKSVQRRKPYFADSMMANPALFHPVVLRRRVFNFQETFYLVEEAGEVVGCLSVLTEFPMKKCSHVNLILFRPDVAPSRYLPALLDTAFSHLEKDELKLKVCVNSATTSFDELSDILTRAGFHEEARLENEYDFGVHEHVYAKHVEAE